MHKVKIIGFWLVSGWIACYSSCDSYPSTPFSAFNSIYALMSPHCCYIVPNYVMTCPPPFLKLHFEVISVYDENRILNYNSIIFIMRILSAVYIQLLLSSLPKTRSM